MRYATIAYLFDPKLAPFDCLQEVVLPLYILGALIVVKAMIPNPNFPALTTQRHEGDIFELFNGYKNNTIAVVPNSTETVVSTSPQRALPIQYVESNTNTFAFKCYKMYIYTYMNKIIILFHCIFC